MLGIHISVAVAWQRASAGDWTNYAADYSRRGDQLKRRSLIESPNSPRYHALLRGIPTVLIPDSARGPRGNHDEEGGDGAARLL